jgi:WD40 repeat protein
VHSWINQTLGVRHASPALFALPAPGELLVSGSGGAWTVAANGSKRRLGPWQQASFSPHGLYVAVASVNELTVVDMHGTPRWSVARHGVSFPRWFSPNGYRVAYLSDGSLRVIAGDGTADRQLAGHVAPIAPAWRPGHEYQLAYISADGSIVVRDADTGGLQFSRREASAPRLLAWSANGSRLLVLTERATLVFDASGRAIARVALSVENRSLDAALSPDGRTLALLSNRDVTLTNLNALTQPSRQIFTGEGLRQLAWAPDGQWLLVSWPAADQWIFVHTTGRPRIAAVSRIAEQFTTPRSFPALDGWCCTATGTSG